jgi:hypothetical protein
MAGKRGNPGRRRGRDAREAENARREADEIGGRHEANVNQVRDEPVPAGQHDDPGQEAVVRNKEQARAREGRRQ